MTRFTLLSKSMRTDSPPQINIRFYLFFIPVAYLSYLFHEFGHWSVGEMLGNRMVYSLNYVWPKSGQYIAGGHNLYVLLGGPAFSLLEAIIALLIIERFKLLYAYPFAFFPFFNRIFSLLLGGFSRQDEAKIAILMNTGAYTIAIVVVTILLFIAIRCSYKLGIDLKTNSYILTASTLCQVLVIGTYEFLNV